MTEGGFAIVEKSWLGSRSFSFVLLQHGVGEGDGDEGLGPRFRGDDGLDGDEGGVGMARFWALTSFRSEA